MEYNLYIAVSFVARGVVNDDESMVGFLTIFGYLKVINSSSSFTAGGDATVRIIDFRIEEDRRLR